MICLFCLSSQVLQTYSAEQNQYQNGLCTTRNLHDVTVLIAISAVQKSVFPYASPMWPQEFFLCILQCMLFHTFAPFSKHSPWSKTGFLTCMQMVSKSLVQELHYYHHHHFHCNSIHAGNMSSGTFYEPKIVDALQENAHFVWKTKRIVNEGGFVSIVALLIHDHVISNTTNSDTVGTI